MFCPQIIDGVSRAQIPSGRTKFMSVVGWFDNVMKVNDDKQIMNLYAICGLGLGGLFWVRIVLRCLEDPQ